MLVFMYIGVYVVPSQPANDDALVAATEDSLQHNSEGQGRAPNNQLDDTASSEEGQTNNDPAEKIKSFVQQPEQPLSAETKTEHAHTAKPYSCGCHDEGPRDNLLDRYVRKPHRNIIHNELKSHEILVARVQVPTRRIFEAQSTNWSANGHWKINTHLEWFCCHGFGHSFRHDGEECCNLPCLCSTDMQPEHMSVHAFMYATADYFGIEVLKTLALEKFTESVHLFHETEDFAHVFRVIFSSPMPDEYASPRTFIIDTLIQLPGLWDSDPVKQVLEDMAAVTSAVLKKTQEKQQEKNKKGVIYHWQLQRLGIECYTLQVREDTPQWGENQ